MALETKDGGRAEVEFEDGSVVRIASDTKLAFGELSLRDSGTRVSTVKINDGLAYVNFAGSKDDQFTINFAQESLRLDKDAHFRVEVTQKDAHAGRIQRRSAGRRCIGIFRSRQETERDL